MHFEKPSPAAERRRRFHQLELQREVVAVTIAFVWTKEQAGQPLEDWEAEMLKSAREKPESW